jgi:GNAT superfamily N-acetyltransferase
VTPHGSSHLSFRLAEITDLEFLLAIMRDFYAFERLSFDEARQRRLILQLISDRNLGRLIVFEDAGDLLGYMVLGFGFSLEFHGRDCLLDEFYVHPKSRSRGIGTAAINFAVQTCRDLGIRAVHLEADYFNVRGHEFYKRLGFKDHDRHLMTLLI